MSEKGGNVKRCLCILLAGLLTSFKLCVAEEPLILHDATPIRLRLSRNLSSADAKTGETVDFEVLDDLKVDDVLIVPRGGTSIATVTQAQSKRRMARGGKLDVNIDYVRLANGDKVALRAVKESKGGGHTGAMTGAMVATAIVFFPAAPLFLFMHGKDVAIPKGTEITAYVDGEIKLDRSKFKQSGPGIAESSPVATGAAIAPPPVAARLSSLAVTSEPAGADIELNGKFVGNTPSTIQVQAGSANVTIKKAGFKTWIRAMDLSEGSSITLKADLEEETPNVNAAKP
jgi:hypothetical protein